VNTNSHRARAAIRPPAGYEDYLSRRQAAMMLGLSSEYKVRQFEREGRLAAVRGVMSMAFYPRAQVVALQKELLALVTRPPHRVWTDADLLGRMRQAAREEKDFGPVDLVIETGISIARAERVYRFWQKAGVAAPLPSDPESPSRSTAAAERRSSERTTRATLIRQLRDPDPGVRTAAFDRLRELPR
jgi:hypothetical protein